MNAGHDLARAAQGFLGARFRLHGRDPDLGLDCMGLVEVALARAGHRVRLPCDYTLKMRSIDRFAGVAQSAGLVRAQGEVAVGDILLIHVGPCQYHLGIIGMDGALVHAHAGLRRVVTTPAPHGEIMACWRLCDDTISGKD
ncbi:MAG: C40 family peptidase [Sphingomonadales bacterium]|nr:C40 family peptidase [Sphingomonadales bacterium]MDE2169026.1 C40 family peptidase [Sphingomonadales bacterium]